MRTGPNVAPAYRNQAKAATSRSQRHFVVVTASEDHLRLAWRELSDSVQVGSGGGRVVAVLYIVDGGDSREFCCLLADTPKQDVDVLFGVAESSGAAWDTRWDRGRRACEYVYAEHLAGM